MKADSKVKQNHLNKGGHMTIPGKDGGLGAQHERTRLADAPELGIGGQTDAPEGLMSNHLNNGGFLGGLGASHNQSEKPDAHELEVGDWGK
jgi:hypothetical protein